MSWASPSWVKEAPALHVPAFFFFSGRCSNTVNNHPKLESLLLWHAWFGKSGINAVRWEEKEKKGKVGTFPSPTHSLTIFVILSFESYLKFQPITVRSARTDLCFNKDAQNPVCWGHGSKTLPSVLCSFCCRRAFNSPCSSMPPVFQDKDHFTNLFVQHIVQSATCICNTNGKW